MRERCPVPLIVKGIQTAADAELAVEHGIDAIWVSNHGGRDLDHGPATLDSLREIVDAVGGSVELIVDGGFMRGSDVLKALALGAGRGRPRPPPGARARGRRRPTRSSTLSSCSSSRSARRWG